ncbi:hypothetical protein CLAFUW4_02954 [Fulvia fulva]|uniref:Uncharacterized protein n=1 Tax=Passalora fulva TaxID=5499 RepID=A0A9Q8LAF3_PASFU|nr:uncharacterized protein CLAFUR5_02940 [Fulvia fulva]KAK4632019.1 hypothetical protein CLAFUR4_02947 [Fulvia fulva]KAK4632826.1 hypothetical protein CLAFUR0_02950 [Fulvia fulva]UJO13765.1 hypothetical protein CLAFUR5_02940 [Fulvia fulva]WPV11532.1 hypothetical protein CLAFUW4_02954 [Fulvia fulva]WPV26842.1 hypothetical protein CLAFUW7_02951 [Fulvia fulva]
MSRSLLYIAPNYHSDDSASDSDDEMKQACHSSPYFMSSPAPPQISQKESPMTDSGHDVVDAILLSDDDDPAPQSLREHPKPEARDAAYASDPSAIFQVETGEADDNASSQQDMPADHYESDLPPSYTSIQSDLHARIGKLQQQLATQATELQQKDAHIQHLTDNGEHGSKILGHRARQIYTLQNEVGWAKTRAKKAETVVQAASLAVCCNARRKWPEFGRRIDELSKAVAQAQAE